MARYKLEDIFDLQMGKTPSRNNSEYWNTCDNKWISIGDLTQAGKYITDTKEYLSDVAVEESGIKIIPANTVVMSFKLSIGKTAITSEDMYSNEAIMAFHDKHVVDLMSEYIYYMFKYKDWDEGTNKAVMGKTLNKATLSKVEIEVCPLEKQKEIVELLDKVSTVLDGRNEELKKLDELIKARFVEMFGDIKTNNMNWDKVQMKNVVDIRGRVGWKGYKKEDLRENGPLVLGATHLTDSGDLDLSAPVFLSREKYEESPEIVLQRNDLIFTQRGNTIGKVGLVEHDIGEATINPCVLILRPQNINPIYLKRYFVMEETKDDMWLLNSGSAQPMITQKGIGEYYMMLPPKELQDSFADFVNQVDKSKVA